MPFISIENLSVQFTIYGASSRSLKNRLLSQASGGRLLKSAGDIVSVSALEGLNLEIRDGDRIGLTGHNGSGKTTLLRVLAGIYKPNAGSAIMSGKVTALLDSTAGMDPDLTGIENIYLRGYILGMSRREIMSKIDDISEFTELGDFLNLPMRIYSAGMYTRLAFAISTATNCDILLIDEGIGAGDAEFQKKAHERVEKLFGRTPIVLLASHSEALLAQHCNRRVTLQAGRLVADSAKEIEVI